MKTKQTNARRIYHERRGAGLCVKCKRASKTARCKRCNKERYKRYQNDERAQRVTREWRRKARQIVLDHYGRRCVCCNETIEQFLQMDHIPGGGARHYKQIGGSGTVLYHWLIKHNFPEGFQILCANCNFAKGKYGICPHVVLRYLTERKKR